MAVTDRLANDRGAARTESPRDRRDLAGCRGPVLVLAVLAALLLVGADPGPGLVAAAPPFPTGIAGNPAETVVAPLGGVALMGGGPDDDAAFRWLGRRAAGGDVLVLRTPGDDTYNRNILRVAAVESVQTIVFGDRGTASGPAVL